jgi:ribonuclease HI
VFGKGYISDTECDSHRAECYGILGGLKTWLELKTKFELTTKHTVRICCDNKSAFSFAGNRQIYKEITSKIQDFDILQAIRKLTLAQDLSFHYVKGHQDREQKSLDFYATLNVQGGCSTKPIKGEPDDRWRNMGRTCRRT